MKVIDTFWFAAFRGTCGIVLGEEDNTGDPVAYIAVVPGHDSKQDTEDIIAWGNKFHLDTALRIANHLAPKKKRRR